MREVVVALGYEPVVPPKRNFTRYDKSDVLSAGFILFAMIIDSLM